MKPFSEKHENLEVCNDFYYLSRKAESLYESAM